MADNELAKRKQITGSARIRLGNDLRGKYEKGASIRELAKDTGRSYGFVHRLLSETGVVLRPRSSRPYLARRSPMADSLSRSKRTRS